MKQLGGKKVLILGLGLSGLAMARWCLRCGADVGVWDSREEPPQKQALLALNGDVNLRSGVLTEADLQGLGWLLKSPGLAPHDPAIADCSGKRRWPLACARAANWTCSALALGRPEGRHRLCASSVLVDHRNQWQNHDHGPDGA